MLRENIAIENRGQGLEAREKGGVKGGTSFLNKKLLVGSSYTQLNKYTEEFPLIRDFDMTPNIDI